MSVLIQLLSVGRSLVAPQHNGYRLRARRPGAAAGLARPATKASPSARPIWKLPLAWFDGGSEEPVSVTLGPTTKTPLSNRAGSGCQNHPPNQLAASRMADPPSAARPLPELTTGLKSERALFAFRPAARDRIPTAERAPSLDAVKVMRNDLTDADVEVIPVPDKPVGTPPKTTPAESEAAYTNSDWSRLAAKFSVLTRVRV